MPPTTLSTEAPEVLAVVRRLATEPAVHRPVIRETEVSERLGRPIEAVRPAIAGLVDAGYLEPTIRYEEGRAPVYFRLIS